MRHYFLKEWKANLRARPLVTLVIVVLGAAGLVISTVMQTEFGLASSWWEDRFAGPFAEIYFDASVDEDEGLRLCGQLRADKRILNAAYISTEDAQAEAESYLGALAFSVLPENPLPSSARLEITPEFRSGTAVQRLVDSLAMVPGIAEIVTADQQLALYAQGRETIARYSQLAAVAAPVWTGLWLFCGVYLVARVRAPEARIWHYLGVRPGWFRWPLMFEGALLGLASSIAAGFVLISSGNTESSMADSAFTFVIPVAVGIIAGWLAYRVQRHKAFSF